MSQGLQIARKITVAGINNVKGGFVLKDGEDNRHVARIVGLAQSAGVKETAYGPSWRFVGEFRAINEDGEEIAAPVLYLPAPADEMLSSAVAANPSGGVQFAFDIFMIRVEKKTPIDRGYQFVVKTLMDSKPSNPVLSLMASLPPTEKKAKQLALSGTENAGESAKSEAQDTAPNTASENDEKSKKK